jgi:hypothetical protein
MNKQQQEFETWLVEQMTLKRDELTAASPNSQQSIRQVLWWLELARSKYLELIDEQAPTPEPAPHHVPATHPKPKVHK